MAANPAPMPVPREPFSRPRVEMTVFYRNFHRVTGLQDGQIQFRNIDQNITVEHIKEMFFQNVLTPEQRRDFVAAIAPAGRRVRAGQKVLMMKIHAYGGEANNNATGKRHVNRVKGVALWKYFQANEMIVDFKLWLEGQKRYRGQRLRDEHPLDVPTWTPNQSYVYRGRDENGRDIWEPAAAVNVEFVGGPAAAALPQQQGMIAWFNEVFEPEDNEPDEDLGLEFDYFDMEGVAPSEPRGQGRVGDVGIAKMMLEMFASDLINDMGYTVHTTFERPDNFQLSFSFNISVPQANRAAHHVIELGNGLVVADSPENWDTIAEALQRDAPAPENAPDSENAPAPANAPDSENGPAPANAPDSENAPAAGADVRGRRRRAYVAGVDEESAASSDEDNQGGLGLLDPPRSPLPAEQPCDNIEIKLKIDSREPIDWPTESNVTIRGIRWQAAHILDIIMDTVEAPEGDWHADDELFHPAPLLDINNFGINVVFPTGIRHFTVDDNYKTLRECGIEDGTVVNIIVLERLIAGMRDKVRGKDKKSKKEKTAGSSRAAPPAQASPSPDRGSTSEPEGEAVPMHVDSETKLMTVADKKNSVQALKEMYDGCVRQIDFMTPGYKELNMMVQRVLANQGHPAVNYSLLDWSNPQLYAMKTDLDRHLGMMGQEEPQAFKLMIQNAQKEDAIALSKQADAFYRNNNIRYLVVGISQMIFSESFKLLNKWEADVKMMRRAIYYAVEAAYTDEFNTNGMCKTFPTVVQTQCRLKASAAAQRLKEIEIELLKKQNAEKDALLAEQLAKIAELERQRGPLAAAANAAAAAAAAIGMGGR
jgi:hypothetical protein